MTVMITSRRQRVVTAGNRWAPLFMLVGMTVALVAVEPSDALTSFATLFLGVLFEALPFLLVGVLVSSAVQQWVSPALIRRLSPAGRLRGALAGALLGAVFPVCECGVVPVARRLLDKGASMPAALGFLLAGPVVNPIVFAATWTALGAEMAMFRLLLSLGIAVSIAWLFGFHPDPTALIRPSGITESPGTVSEAAGRADRVLDWLVGAATELLEMGRYLVIGAAAAAVLRTVVPGTSLIAFGQGPILSVGLMMVLAALLSICSVVDAFVALSLSGLASSGAMLAFLVFGPVVDLKSVVMYGAIFRWRMVLVLALLLTQVVFLIGVALNLNIG